MKFRPTLGTRLFKPPLYGPELLTNRDFNTGDLTGWSAQSSFSNVTNQLYNDGSAVNQTCSQSVLVVGTTYRITMYVITNSVRFLVQAGGATEIVTGAGEVSLDMTCTSSGIFIIRANSSSSTFTIDNVSVKKLL